MIIYVCCMLLLIVNCEIYKQFLSGKTSIVFRVYEIGKIFRVIIFSNNYQIIFYSGTKQ